VEELSERHSAEINGTIREAAKEKSTNVFATE
jgi:hypothetical protein